MNRVKKKSQFICFCNGITKNTIEEAIKNGAHSLDEIFDHTTAGVGGCGGSCRSNLKIMLDGYQKNGEFPEIPKKRRK